MIEKKYKNLENRKGFTLIEIILVVFIFSIVILMTVSIFTVANKTQRQVLEKYALQKEGAYLMEMISRELRMATGLKAIVGGLVQKNLNGTAIEFQNYDLADTKYCRSDDLGVCDSNGSYLARNNKVLNSSKVLVSDLKIYTTNDFASNQPLITISLRVKYNSGLQDELYLQNSVAYRVY